MPTTTSWPRAHISFSIARVGARFFELLKRVVIATHHASFHSPALTTSNALGTAMSLSRDRSHPDSSLDGTTWRVQRGGVMATGPRRRRDPDRTPSSVARQVLSITRSLSSLDLRGGGRQRVRCGVHTCCRGGFPCRGRRWDSLRSRGQLAGRHRQARGTGRALCVPQVLARAALRRPRGIDGRRRQPLRVPGLFPEHRRAFAVPAHCDRHR